MKLEKFKEKDKKKVGVIVFTIVCVLLISGVILYRTFAIFEVKTNQNVIKGKVGDMGDIQFAFYINNEIVKDAPSKEQKVNYVFDEENSNCTNGANVYWDYQQWGPMITNITKTKTKCNLKFKTEYSEEILNGAVPKIEENLVPVTIDEDGTVRKADITTKWYNYGEQKWANAVITGNSYELLGNNIFEAEKKDGYVHLDGVNDYIDLGLENYEFHDQITLAINVSFDNDIPNTSTDYNVFGNWETAGGGIIVKNHHFRNYLWIDDSYKPIESDVVVEPNTEYTVVVTYDGSTIKMWVNGEKQTQEISQTGDIVSTAAQFSIGCNPGNNHGHGNFANLNVKQAAVFNRAIDDKEVADISNNFKITNSDKLLKYVDFTNKTYENNEVISEDNIESYFVWIPRYKYQIWNGEEETSQYKDVQDLGIIQNATLQDKINQTKKIKIEFENKHMPISEGNLKNQWLTHPAFTSFNSNGFWVGKFETGYKGAADKEGAQQNTQEKDKVIIKPNVYAWRAIQVANAFNTSKDYNVSLDSHMMKNMEWGAVAYLTDSQYGRCSGEKCEKVRINNSSDYITGSSAVQEPTCGYTGTSETCNQYEPSTEIVNNYNSQASVVSSTTNNRYGIYDMAGGSWEYVMGVMKVGASNDTPASGADSTNNSGFNGSFSNGESTKDNGVQWPDEKYYDLYDYDSTDKNYYRGHLGDGTEEFGPFYQVKYQKNDGTGPIRYVGTYNAEGAYFVANHNPWFRRGGLFADGTDSGVSDFERATGNASATSSFRIVLTP